jgi:hypothetical protein
LLVQVNDNDDLEAVLGSELFAELSAHSFPSRPTSKPLTEHQIEQIESSVFEMHTSIDGEIALDLMAAIKHWHANDCDECGGYLFEFLIGLLTALAAKIHETIGDSDDLG